MRNNFLGFWDAGNGGYPRTDLNLGQKSKFKIFKFCFVELLSSVQICPR